MNRPPDLVFAEVRDTDPDSLDSAELDQYLRRIAELRAWCDAKQVRATRRRRELASRRERHRSSQLAGEPRPPVVEGSRGRERT
jgi:hypothetical protein